MPHSYHVANLEIPDGQNVQTYSDFRGFAFYTNKNINVSNYWKQVTLHGPHKSPPILQ